MRERPAAAIWAPLVLLLCLSGTHAALQKGASLTLRARWQSTSYLMEAAEFVVSWNRP